jgi:hypothetical protein
MSARPGIRWTRILLYGFAGELFALMLVLIVRFAYGPVAGQYAAIPASFVAAFVFGWLLARRVDSSPLLAGFLVGAAAVLIYVGIGTVGRIVAWLAGLAPPGSSILAVPSPPYIFEIAHAMKLLGGAAGGLAAVRRAEQDSMTRE